MLRCAGLFRLFRKRMARGRILLPRRGRSTITLYISGRMDEVRRAPNTEPRRMHRRNRGSIDNSPHHRSGPSIAWVADAGIHRGNPQEPRCPSAVSIVADPSVVVAAVVDTAGNGGGQRNPNTRRGQVGARLGIRGGSAGRYSQIPCPLMPSSTRRQGRSTRDPAATHCPTSRVQPDGDRVPNSRPMTYPRRS
jgi:hypothetical protein